MLTRWRWCALVAATAVGLTVAAPPGAVPAGGDFPVGWLTSWFAQRPAWAWGESLRLPQAPVGDGAGPGGYASSSATRASGGAGKAQRLVDGLPGEVPSPAPAESVTPATVDHFDPKTSERDAKASRSSMDLYVNADGSQTRQFTTVRSNYRAADGSWRPIDSTLVRRGDRWAVKANSLGVSLAATVADTDSAADDPLVEVSVPAGGSVGWSLSGAAAVTPVVDGATATYPKVLPETDLELVARADGVKETLVLASPRAASEWVFPLALRGLTARSTKGGSVELVDGAGKVAASIPAAFMQDSSMDTRTGLPARSSAVSMELVEVNGGSAVKLVADRAWLTDPARVYPVRVDPTVTAAADDDVYVDTDANTGPDAQNGDYLAVGVDSSGTKARSFLNFDIGDVVTDALPSIANAWLDLYLSHQSSCTATRLRVNLVEEGWTVVDLASGSYPGPAIDTGIGSGVSADPGVACSNTAGDRSVGTWVTIDVRQLVDHWSGGGENHGLVVRGDEDSAAVWRLFTSANYGSGAFAPRLRIDTTSNLPPQVDTRSPTHGSVVSTLTPRLLLRGHDPDSNVVLIYEVNVYDEAGNLVHKAVTDDEAPTSTVSVPIPAGLLKWNSTYSWSVQPYDGRIFGPRYPKYVFYTRVPQPALASRLAQNPGVGYHPEIGNYTTSVTDAQVAGVGPALEITRSYNSLDTRRSGAFGQGWSSLLDARVTERTDAAGALQSVVVTYPDGSEGAFGPNADGSFAAPSGRYEVLKAVGYGGSVNGYTLTDKHATTYAFGQPTAFGQPPESGVFKLISVTDANGLALTLSYGRDGLVRWLTSASGRSLTLFWAASASPTVGGKHVVSVTTDAPVAGGSGYEWSYTYTSHDRLTKVCPPTSSCTTYTWGNSANQAANAVLDHSPSSFWRLNEPTGATWAASGVLANGGTDVGFYENTTAGSVVPRAGTSTSTSTSFNGESSRVRLPSGLVRDGAHQSISLWFRTTDTDQVLFSYQHDPITAGTTTGNYTPVLYVGSSGKLRAKFWDGDIANMVTAGTVNDGAWHHAVLAGAGDSQTLYLDGLRQASANGAISMFGYGGSAHEYVGAGFLGGGWADQSHHLANGNTGYANFFDGEIADVAFFDHTLTATDVSELYAPSASVTSQLSDVTSADGRTLSSLSMDSVTGKLSSMTDSNGGTWTMGTSQVSGSSALYAAAVLGSVPTDYWRLRDAAGTDAVNETWNGVATYSSATLGAAGPFADGTAASFNGSSSLVSVPGAHVAPAGASTQELWFKTTATSGVLLGVQNAAVGGSPSVGLPVLWIDSGGKLRGLSPSTTPTGPLTSGLVGKCVVGGSTNNGVVQLGTCNGSSKQSWRLTASKQLTQSGLCMDVVSSGTADGTKVRMHTCNNTSAQVWEPYRSGWRNPNSGKCLDDPGASTRDGTDLIIWTCNGAANQRWTLSLGSSTPVNDGKWHHAVLTTAGTADPNRQVLYLDGVAVQSSTGQALTPGPQPYGYLGAGYTGTLDGLRELFDNSWSGLPPASTVYFTGSLAEAVFYNKALSADDVALHYKSVAKTAPLVVTAGSSASVSLSNTAAGSLSSVELSTGATQVDAAARGAGTASVPTPVKIVSVTDPSGHQLSYSYDLVTGRKVAQSDALGNVTLHGYDTGGFTSLEYDPNGIATRTVQDERGNTIQQVTCQDQAAQKCSSSYYSYYWNPDNVVDPRNDRMTTARGPGSQSASDARYLTSYSFDAAGNPLSTTDPLGRATTITYTNGTSVAAVGGGYAPAGLPWKVVDPSGGLRTITYTAAGDVAKVVDPAGATTTYTYDLLGRELTETLVTSSFPVGRTTSYTYDSVNRVVTRTDPAVTNRVTGAVHTQVTENSFDQDGFLVQQTVRDATGGDVPRVSKAGFDSHGHRASTTDAVGNTTTYTYDAYGHLVGQTDPDGVASVYHVDANGNLLSRSLKDYTGDPNDPQDPVDLVVESNTYDPAGRLASTTDALGYVTRYRYTDDGKTATVTRADGSDPFLLESNSYDAAGNLVTRLTNNGQTTTTFQYDAAGRQTGSVLDPGGLNRVTTLTLSKDDQVRSSLSQDGSGTRLALTTYAHDVLGRQLSQTRYPSPDPTTTPVARWRLDETAGTTAADSAGNSPGTATDVTWRQDAERGPVASFNGTTSQITTAGSVVDTTQPYTVAAWLQADATAHDGTVLEVPGSAVDQPAFRLSYEAATNGWRARVAGRRGDGYVLTGSRAIGEGTVRAGAWQHVAVGVNPGAGTFTVYLNGVWVNRYGGAGFTSVASGPVLIGGSARGMFHGAISDLRVYQGGNTTGNWAAGVAAGAVPATGAATVSRTTYVLDSGGLARSVVDALGNTSYVDYDEADRPVVSTAPPVQAESGDGSAAVTARPVISLGYDTFGDLTEEADPNGQVTTHVVDRLGREYETKLPTYTPPDGADPITPIAKVAYDSLGQVVSQTDPLGRTTGFTHDQLGRPVTQVAPDGGKTTASYDLLGNLLTSTDPTGAVTARTYDMLGKVTSASEAVRQTGQVHTTTVGYDTAGRMATVTTPAGMSTRYGYNRAGEVAGVVDGAGQTTGYSYDGLGRAVKQTNPDGTFTVTNYDMLSQPTSTAAYPAGGGTALKTSNWAYDAAGNMRAATDARGTTTRFGYDATGLLRSQSQPVDAATTIGTSFGYDLAGNQTRFTDGRGNAFLTTYNPWDLPQSQIEPATAAYPDAADRTYTTVYDAAGQPVSRTAPGGVRQTYTYDEAGRLTRQAGSGAEAHTANRNFGYDKAGRLTSFSAPDGTNTVSYDDRGLPLAVAGPSGNSSFTYTADGLVASRADRAGTTRYTYDTADRLASVTNTDAGVSVGYSYNAMSAVSSMAYGSSGNRRVFGYDNLHRLTSDTLTNAAGDTVAAIGYGWDPGENETSKTVTRDGSAVTNTYTYDLADRLTSWDNGTTTIGYRYDGSGNRTGVGATDHVYDQRNRLVSDNTGKAYSYTARGTQAATTSGGTSVTSTADAFDQTITQQSAGGAQQTYTYDALGRALLDGFAYTGLDNDLAADGTAGYPRDPTGAPVAVSASGTSRLMWTDLHDDVVAQLDTTGATVTGTSTYSPLGEVDASTGMLGDLGYQSEWTDPVTSRVNMHARWYNPATGQFDTRDSATNSAVPDSINANRYQYGDGSPLTVTDPTGHFGQRLRKAFHKDTLMSKMGWNTVAGAARNLWDKVSGAVRDVREQIAQKVNDLKQKVSQAYQRHVQAGKLIKAVAERVSQWAQTAKDWIVEHKADIVGAIVGVIVGAGCMVAVGWTGVGAVACGVASGVAGALVTGGMQGHTGVDLLKDAAIGGLAGGLGAALPGMGSAASKALGKAVGAASKTIGKTFASASGKVAGTARGLGQGARREATAVSRATSRSTREVAEYTDDTARAGSRADDVTDVAKGCAKHSFAPRTRVRMADGTTKAISDVRLDDKVLATDPATGTTTARPVRALHHNDDTELTNVTVADTKTGTSTVLHTTAHHPFWNASTGEWTDAADLKPGDRLRGPDGETSQQVTMVKTWTSQARMNDLTIAGDHTYYVLASTEPVLVHNCGGAHTGHSNNCTCGYDDAGGIVNPPDNGFVGASSNTVLQPGTRISRFGPPTGTFVSPSNVSFWARALPLRKIFGEYHEYVVLKAMYVRSGRVAPWFGMRGGGIQYRLRDTVDGFVQSGVLRDLGPVSRSTWSRVASPFA
jgi:RHS repeat-associated protein